MKFRSKTVVNNIVEITKSFLPDFLPDNIKLSGVQKGKKPVFNSRNRVVISGRGYKPKPNGDRTYFIEFYFTVSHERPDELEDLVCDFSDSVSELFETYPDLKGNCYKIEELDCEWFVQDERNLHIAIGKMNLEVYL